MNILLVNISLDAALGGGTAERTRHLARHLAQAGAQVHAVAMTGNSWAEEFAAAGISWYVTGRLGRRMPLPWIRQPRALWQAVRQADAIHIMGYWNLLSVAVGLLARLARTPYVLCPAGEFASVARPRPVMRVFHAVLGRWLIRGAAAFIAITALERDQIAAVTGRPRSHIWILPNAVTLPAPSAPSAVSAVRQVHDTRAPDASSDEADDAPATMPGQTAAATAARRTAPPGGPYLLFMGRLAPIKGPDLLLEAYIGEPALHLHPLVFAGPDFGMQAELEARVQAAGPEVASRIHFIGFVPEAERAAVYRGAMLLVVPSRNEAMSLVALEAGAMGVPVLLTQTCGFDEVQQAGGGLVVAADAARLREGLRELMARRHALPAMGAALRTLIANHYSWPVIARQMIRRLRSLAAAAPARR